MARRPVKRERSRAFYLAMCVPALIVGVAGGGMVGTWAGDTIGTHRSASAETSAAPRTVRDFRVVVHAGQAVTIEWKTDERSGRDRVAAGKRWNATLPTFGEQLRVVVEPAGRATATSKPVECEITLAGRVLSSTKSPFGATCVVPS